MFLWGCASADDSIETTSGQVLQKDDWVYFSSGTGNATLEWALYKMRPDGKDLELMTKIKFGKNYLSGRMDLLLPRCRTELVSHET